MDHLQKMALSITYVHFMWSISCTLYFSSALSTFPPNFCPNEPNAMTCCTGYYLSDGKENKTCLECVGAIGRNCSVPCPPRFYGKSCKLQCQCSESQCDRVKGCLKISKASVLDALRNLFGPHWLIIAVGGVILLFIAICPVLIYVIIRNRKRNRIQRETRSGSNRAYVSHTLPFEPTSAYEGMICTPHASTEYLSVSFQSKPVDNPTRYM
uniref:Uncharacterized protein LOC111138236 n=1 Tax=Crassostrea virginica TaxID=6565 RepID=A0A8B8F0M2_CRAVI|nr:uncharacterized protein LOC111138236 [Crassostrea virginica]